MIGTLFRNEMIKTRHRLGFWVTLLGFTGLITLIFAEPYAAELRRGGGAFVLPDAWQPILGETGPLGAFFAAVVLILLITGEFSWRTARQNVIDGLSKEQWFAAKLMLLPLVAILFVLVQDVLGSAFAALVTDFDASSAAVIREQDIRALAGQALSTLGFCSMAFLLAFAVRASGPAIALFFLYVAIVEQLVVRPLLRRWDALASVADFTPGNVFIRLIDSTQYYAEAAAKAAEVAAKTGRAVPQLPDTSHLMIAGGVYTVLFVAAAFAIYRRRDL